MSRKIEVELTSQRDDGTWTWRAAGAKKPKGELKGSLLPDGAKVGDVLKAEAEFALDGIDIVSVQTPATGDRKEPERIEVLGPSQEFQPVISNVSKKGRDDRRGKKRRSDDAGPKERRDRKPPRSDTKTGPRNRDTTQPERPRAKRLRPGKEHRNGLIQELPAEERPVAEQLIRGGMPAVRQAIAKQNEEARGGGAPEVPEATVVALAEKLQKRVRRAEWLDKAAAAKADIEDIDLRDLRTVVVAADDVARDDETRALAAELREALTARVEKDQTEWLTELAELVRDGRVVRALRLSSRPPKAGSQLPTEVQTSLVHQTREQFSSEVSEHRWGVVIDALAYSPIRGQVVPETVPDAPGGELMATVKKHAGRLPELAAKFGVAPSRATPRPAKATAPQVPPPPPPPDAQPPDAQPPDAQPPGTQPA